MPHPADIQVGFWAQEETENKIQLIQCENEVEFRVINRKFIESNPDQEKVSRPLAAEISESL